MLFYLAFGGIEVSIYTFKVLFQSPLQCGWNKAPVTAASIKMQEKLSHWILGPARMPKGLYLLLCKHAMRFFILPARHQCCLQVLRHKPTTSSCPVPPVRAWGCLRTECIYHGTEPPPASGKCRAGNCSAPKQQAKTHWAFTDFISRPKNRTRPFCLEEQEQVTQDFTVPNVQGWGWRKFNNMNQPGRLFLLIGSALPLALRETQLLHW